MIGARTSADNSIHAASSHPTISAAAPRATAKRKRSRSSISSAQASTWEDRYQQLLAFHRQHGHCSLERKSKRRKQQTNQEEEGQEDEDYGDLLRWMKRQRYQFTLKQQGKRSFLTDERQRLLEELGFVWDSHSAVWEERFLELKAFKERHGHCNVTKRHDNRSLAIWVQCQRRHWKLSQTNQRQQISPERVAKLEGIGFVWNPLGG